MVAPSSGSEMAVGIYAVQNGSSEPIKIESVQLIKPANLELKDAVVVPVTTVDGTRSLVGAGATYPPDAAALSNSTVAWAARQDAVGSSILPRRELDKKGEDINLVLGIAVDGSSGTADGVVVKYRGAGRSFTWKGRAKILIKVSPGACF